jgi:hypothetical protein
MDYLLLCCVLPEYSLCPVSAVTRAQSDPFELVLVHVIKYSMFKFEISSFPTHMIRMTIATGAPREMQTALPTVQSEP